MFNNNNKSAGKALLTHFSRLRGRKPAPDRADSVRQWVESLPRANAQETARQVLPALEELNRAEREPGYRLAALEAMRPTVHLALRGLARKYLNQPLGLSPDAAGAVAMCDRLNRELVTGYWVVVGQLAQAGDEASPQPPIHRADPFEDTPVAVVAEDDTEAAEQSLGELTTAAHRAITEHSGLLLRRYQLYMEPAASLWLKLYQMFMFATKRRLLASGVEDPVFGRCTVQQAFLRSLLLAAARPQELSQNDMTEVFRHCADWNGLVGIASAGSAAAALVFRVSEGRPPAPASAGVQAGGGLGIDTRALCARIGELIESGGGSGDGLSPPLLRQLRSAWAGEEPPAPSRGGDDRPLRLALGLYAVHYFAAGEMPFADFIDDDEQKAAQKAAEVEQPRDVWSKSSATDARYKGARPGRFAHQELEYRTALDRYADDRSARQFPLYRARLADAGEEYRYLRWSNADAVHLRIGNVVGLFDEASAEWTLGVLHSIRLCDRDHSLLGVKVLGEAVEAFSARLLQSGLPCGRHRRVFVLRGEPLRLLAPADGFVAGQSLRLTRPGEGLRLKLLASETETTSAAVFRCEFKSVEQRGSEAVERVQGGAG